MSFESEESVILELVQFTTNTSKLYFKEIKPLLLKMAKGELKQDSATNWYNIAIIGAIFYTDEFGGNWSELFPRNIREQVAKKLQEYYEDQIEYARENPDNA